MVENRTWYYRDAEQNRGPFTLSEMGEAIRVGQLSGLTYVWQVGMPTWQLAQDAEEIRGLLPVAVQPPVFPELKLPEKAERTGRLTRKASERAREQTGLLKRAGGTSRTKRTNAKVRAGERFTSKKSPPKFTIAHEDFSGFYELNPQDVDDRTAFVKSSTARSAKKEAHRAMALEGQARSYGFLLKLGLGMALTAGLVVAVVGYTQGTFSVPDGVNRMTAQIRQQVRAVSVDIPNAPDLGSAEHQALLEAATQSSGLALQMVRSTASGLKPTFYIAGNLPAQLKLALNLYSQGHDALIMQVPFQLKHGFTKTDSLSGPGGKALAHGRYVVVVSEEDEQSTQAAEFLRKLPVASNTETRFFTVPKKILFTQSIQIP